MNTGHYEGILNARAIVNDFGFDSESNYVINFLDNGIEKSKIIGGKNITEAFKELECEGCFGTVIKMR